MVFFRYIHVSKNIWDVSGYQKMSPPQIFKINQEYWEPAFANYQDFTLPPKMSISVPLTLIILLPGLFQ